MGTPQELATQAYENLQKQAAAQQKLNDAGALFLAQFGPVAPRDLQIVTQQMRQLQVQGLQRTQQDAAKAKAALVGVPVGIAASVAALTKFSHAANPQLVGALGTQIELLQAKLGNRLLPVFSRLMSGIEDFTGWFDGLSGGMKNLIAGGLVAVPVVLTVAKAVSALGPASRVAMASLAQLRASAAAPYLAAAGGAAAIVGSVALAHQANIDVGGRHLFGGAMPKEGKGQVTQEEMNFARGVMTSSHGMAISDWSAMPEANQRAHAKEEAARQRQLVREGVNNNFTSNLFSTHMADWSFYSHTSNEDRERAAGIMERYAQHGAENTEENKWRKRVTQLQQQSATASREMTPHYSGLSDIHKQMQTAMLAKNPYEQKLLEEQRKSRKVLEQMLSEEMKRGRERGFRVSGAVD